MSEARKILKPLPAHTLPNSNMVGKAINSLRRQMHMSQTELGARLGVSTALVSQWERGQTRVDANDLWRLSEALEVLPHEFIRVAQSSDTSTQLLVPVLDEGGEIVLSSQEKYLVESYRTMTQEQQQLTLRILDVILV